MITEKLVHDQDFATENLAELIDMLDGSFRVERERSSLELIELRSDGTLVTPAAEYKITQDFLENSAKSIGMQLAYAYDLSSELFCENFAQRKFETTCPVTICHVGDVATGMTLDKKHRYRPASTLEVLRGLSKSSTMDWLELRRASVSYRGVDVELVKRDLVVEPDEGDTIEIGIAISNSESGGRQLMAEASSYRLICRNGARMGERIGTARWPSDIRMTDKSCRIAFQTELDELLANLSSVKEMYSHLDDRVPDTELNGLWRRVAYGVSRSEADEILGLSKDQRQILQTTLRERPITELAQLTDLSAFELHNRVTHAAHGRPFMARRKLQELGGDLLERSLKWGVGFSNN